MLFSEYFITGYKRFFRARARWKIL